MISAERARSFDDPGNDTEVADPVPHVRVFAESVTIDADGYGTRFREVQAPLIQLSFRYPDLGETIAADDPRDKFFRASSSGVFAIPRAHLAELEARRVLEGLGAVELACVDAIGVPPDIEADYVVRVDGDRHACCAFSKHGLPELRALGWEIEIDPAYPFQVEEGEARLYAEVLPDDERPDWFALELGVEVRGQRVSLLPVLLDLIDEGGESLHDLGRGMRELALPVSDTHHVTVPTERLQTLMRVLIELYEGAGDVVRFPAARAGALEALDDLFPHETHVPERARKARKLHHVETLVDSPPRLRATLRPYQLEGLRWLQHLRANDAGAVLADDMGLGKTLQCIAHIVVEKAEGRMSDRPCLVVAPKSLMGNWARELRKFAPHLSVVAFHGPQRRQRVRKLRSADVVLTSYPILVRDEALVEQKWHLLVLDEAQAIKNSRSRAHAAARSLDARHRLALSGTPVENHLGELWALFDFVEPELLGSELRFKSWFRTPIERFGDETRLEALRELVRPHILRRRKQDVAKDLPPKTRLRRSVELEGKQRELYESIRLSAHGDVRRAIQKRGLAASTVPILDALMKLRQLCCDPKLVRMHAARFVRESAKMEALLQLVDAQLQGGHRILIFSQFTTMLGLISEELRKRDVRHFMLTGQSRRRQELCDRFEAGEAEVFLISLKAGGVGLNLVSADTVIHYDPWWNPQAQEQATDRAYRIGQTKPVFVYDLFVAGSVEERMLQLQERKRRLADAILEGEAPTVDHLSEADVDVLFSPLMAY